MGLTTEGNHAPTVDVAEPLLPQNRMSTYNTPMQPTPPTNGNGDAERDIPTRHRTQGSQDITDVAINGQERNGRRRSKDESQNTELREQSRPTASRRPSERSRICGKCGGHLTGQFVRALGDTYHLECFTCHVRGMISFPLLLIAIP